MSKTFARQRLRRDWLEVMKEPSPLVAAEPLADNLFEWHANLRPNSGPLSGLIFHVRITFPDDYPTSPPALHFPMNEIPSFRHPNLYGFGLCLDILSTFIGQHDKRAGWSPAYTVRSLLMQLQSFLFEFDAAPQDHGGTYSFRYDQSRIWNVRQEVQKLACKKCGHCSGKVWPALQAPPAIKVSPCKRVSLDEALVAAQKCVVDTRAEMAKLKVRANVVSRELSPQGPEVLTAGKRIAHLSAPCSRLTVRVKAGSPDGGMRVGLGTAGCTGLTQGMESNGCVSWDSAGRLVLGSTVLDGAMPPICVGDEISVAIDQDGLSFSQNGKPVAHDARQVWPQKPLSFFLFNPSAPTRGDGGQVRDIRVMLSFRNGTLEVLEGVSLRDEVAEKAGYRRQELMEHLTKQEAQVEAMHFNLQESRNHILKARAEGLHHGPWATELPRDLLLQALMGLDADDVPALTRVCSGWRQLVVDRSLLERMQVCCFFTKATPWQDVLGFGVTAEYHADGNLKSLASELDVLSLTAFSKFSVRRGVWGEDFAYFLPLVLDGEHASRALPVLETSLARLALGKSVETSSPFEPWMVLAVLPQLMNSFAVSLMNAKEGVTRHTSEKALLGYCSFHHMLLALVARHPCIAAVADDKLRNFLRSEVGRHKAQTPDLGQLLVYCAISKNFSWQDIAATLVKEANVRSVMWLLRDTPHLYSPKTKDSFLVSESFKGRLTGLRLLMFQKFFLCNVAAKSVERPEEALTRYDLQFGLPTSEQKEALFREAKEILAVSTWPAYYKRLGVPCPRDIHGQAVLLRQGAEDSALCGYHTPATSAMPKTRKGAQEDYRRPQRPFLSAGDRVGVKVDLQRAFRGKASTKAEHKPSGQDAGKAAPKAATKTSNVPLRLANRFGALTV
jgi:ubiquitin-protein ligase